MARLKFITMADLTGEPSNSEAHGLNKSMFLLFLGYRFFKLAFDPCENNLYGITVARGRVWNIDVVSLKTGERKVFTKVSLALGLPMSLVLAWTSR